MKKLVLLTIVFTACSETKQTNEGTWGLVNSTMQLVYDSVDPAICPSGWTKLLEELSAQGQDQLVPLQRQYVTRFVNLKNFKNASLEAKGLLENTFPVFRLSLLWPCWQENTAWQSEMIDLIKALKDAGWKVEVTLLHHDSYPASLHTGNLASSGWANSNASSKFIDYVQSTVEALKGILPRGTRFFIANEPIATLYNGYLNPEGKWPPGGKRAPKSMAQAMLGMRQAFFEAEPIIKNNGFVPVIAQNIRPMTNKLTPAAKTLDYIWNWWLLDALVRGCLDDDFDGVCEKQEESPKVEEIGITFYGTMEPSGETVAFGIPGGQEVEMALPNMNFSPNAQAFETALNQVFDRYAEVLPFEKVGVAEIGFSASRTETMVEWLNWYRTVIARNAKPIAFVELHTLFKSAEFSVGDWVFHLVEGCLSEPCRLTPWGKAVLKELR